MKNLLKIMLTVTALALAACACRRSQQAEEEPRYRNILIRDFRKGKDGIIVSYNIGTTAHCPGTIASLRKLLPDDVRITVWADMPLDPVIRDMMEKRWPDVRIVYGQLGGNAPEELRSAVEASDLLLVSSGSGVAASVAKSIREYKSGSGKAVGAYAVGAVPRDLLGLMDFVWYRDEKSLAKAPAGDMPEIFGFAPDAGFDFDCVDEQTASRLLADKGLLGKDFICCIPGFRYTPAWEYFGSRPDSVRIEANMKMEDHDNGILRHMICQSVRDRGMEVLICPEQIPELRLAREAVLDRLPEDVRGHCAVLDTMWSPQTALSVYRRARAVAGIQMHSEVMAIGSGIPAIVLRHSGFGNKSDMWRSIGLGDWLIDIDDPDAQERAGAALADILDHPEKAQGKVRQARKAIDEARDSAIRKTFFIQ